MKMNDGIYERSRKERRAPKSVVLRVFNVCVTDRPTDLRSPMYRYDLWPLFDARGGAYASKKKVSVAKNGEIRLRVGTNLRSFS